MAVLRVCLYSCCSACLHGGLSGVLVNISVYFTCLVSNLYESVGWGSLSLSVCFPGFPPLHSPNI